MVRNVKFGGPRVARRLSNAHLIYILFVELAVVPSHVTGWIQQYSDGLGSIRGFATNLSVGANIVYSILYI